MNWRFRDWIIGFAFILLVLWWAMATAGPDLDKEQRIKDRTPTSLTNPFIDHSNEGDYQLP